MKPYRPKKVAIEARALMQETAFSAVMTVNEMSDSLGYSCPYKLLKDIIKDLEKNAAK